MLSTACFFHGFCYRLLPALNRAFAQGLLQAFPVKCGARIGFSAGSNIAMATDSAGGNLGIMQPDRSGQSGQALVLRIAVRQFVGAFQLDAN